MKPLAPSRSWRAGAAPTITESPTAVTGTGGGGGRGTVGAGAVAARAGPGTVAARTGRPDDPDVDDVAEVDCVVDVSAAGDGGGGPWAARTFSPRRRLAAMGSVPGRRATITITA